jgi:hypothetical protein
MMEVEVEMEIGFIRRVSVSPEHHSAFHELSEKLALARISQQQCHASSPDNTNHKRN